MVWRSVIAGNSAALGRAVQISLRIHDQVPARMFSISLVRPECVEHRLGALRIDLEYHAGPARRGPKSCSVKITFIIEKQVPTWAPAITFSFKGIECLLCPVQAH